MTQRKFITGLMMAAAVSTSAHAGVARRGRVLVIVSSENQMKLRNGKIYPTGYYFNELTVPVRAVVEAGYEVTFANPKGNRATMDVHSDSASYFGDDVSKYEDYKRFHQSLTGLNQPSRLSDIVRGGLGQFDGVFFPGGHAPMIDLLDDPDVRQVLQYFHRTGRATALICHGPISLLAALPNSTEVVGALRAGDVVVAKKLAKSWIYSGYDMTIFSTAEEKVAEAGQLGGNVLFYPDVALGVAGGEVQVRAPWTNHAVRDRELITGQNPFSDDSLAKLFLQALNEGFRR